jgi:hypothetical protein
MNYKFKEENLQVLNKLFEDEITNQIINIEERLRGSNKRRTSLVPGTCGRLMSTITGVEFPEFFAELFNETSNHYTIDRWNKNTMGQFIIYISEKCIELRVKNIVYKYNQSTKELESVGGSRKITGIEAEQVKLACKYIEILALEEPFSITYKEFSEMVGKYMLSGKKAA